MYFDLSIYFKKLFKFKKDRHTTCSGIMTWFGKDTANIINSFIEPNSYKGNWNVVLIYSLSMIRS
jgi:hypothetical protein